MLFAPIIRRALPRRRHLGLLLAASLAVLGAPVAAVADAKAIQMVSAAPVASVGFDGLVYTSTYVGNTMYVGGSFRNALVDGKPVLRKRLAALDARTGKLLPWAPAIDGTVFGMTAAGTQLYVTGKFKNVGGQARAGLAGIDLKTGAVGPLKHTVDGEGSTLAAGGGRLYLGGTITKVDGKAVKNLAAFRLPGGAVDTAFPGTADAQVRALTVAGSRLYVGGKFKKLNGAGTARFGALKTADGTVDTTFRPATPYEVFGITLVAGKVYAGLGGVGGRVAAYKADGGFIWSTVTDGDIQAITNLGGAIYAGGHFTEVCPTPSASATTWCPGKKLRSQPKVAALDGATGKLLAWNPRSNGKWGVLTMDANPALSKIALGGEFTAFGGVSRPHFAQFSACAYGCGGRAE
ncbi:hypothetical protein ACIBSW_28180 [Actinoplanes sp. NPDC049668]|uniref:hypothetical protein n=1 Tax=unclassified Actinoplanes TaxID=2626549 RepID=UPI0033A04AD0